jgi:GxxExxY protein
MKEPSQRQNQLSHEVIGAAIEVHKIVGSGYLESAYEEALCVELEIRGIPFKRQYAVDLTYKGHKIGQGKLDILIDDQLVIELKAVEDLAPIHEAQVISYLKMTRLPLGLLLNFNVTAMKDGIKRVVLSTS